MPRRMSFSGSLLAGLAVLAVVGSAHTQATKKGGPTSYDALQDTPPRAYYTASWAVEITAGGAKMADLIAKRNGFTNLGEVGGLEDIYHFELNARERLSVPRFTPFTKKSKHLFSETNVGFVEQQVVRPRVAKSYSVPEDPLFPSQWQLLNSGQLGEGYAGNDLRVEQAWMQGLTGCNTTVTIVDDGLDFSHTDLWSNFVPEISYNFYANHNDTSTFYPIHGTACGGVVGALNDDRTCGVGVAHEVNLGGVALLGANSDINEAHSLSYKREIVDIYSNSWGPYDSGDNVEGPGHLTKMALESGVKQGRNGKGSIYVWANGNGGVDDDCAADGYASTIYTISVGSIGVDGRPSQYDEECSAKMIVTYVTNMYGDSTVSTTTLDDGCTTDFGGTSAATPLAAGVIALALEANPSLTWRDVQYLIAYTANPHLTAGPLTRNGAGLAVSRQYGFGVMDAEAMVTRARHWINVPPQMNDSVTPDDYIGSANLSSPFVSTLNYSGSVQYLEHVIVTMTISNISEGPRGNIGASLTSPSGTVSTLLGYRKYDSGRSYWFGTSISGYNDWPFMSVQFWGEDPTGQWTLNVTAINNSTAIVSGIEVTFYGVSQVPEAVANIPDQCHPNCSRGCAREGSDFCDSCVNLRNAYTLECIDECPSGYTNRSGYCYDSSLPIEKCNSPLKKKDEALCVDAGYTSCCTDENCEVRVETSPVSCFCDAACHDYNDCCSDILDIGCTDYCEKHPCGILPYIVVGVTEGVDTFSVPAFDDGVSEPVEVAFPIGQSIKPFVQVGTNGYFTFDGYNGYIPFSFDERNQSIVAPFFTDIDISQGVGQIRYEVHRENTILDKVNELINNCSLKDFTGNWLLVATWEDVPWYQKPDMKSTFQGMLVTDSINSYAVFTYYCGDLSYSPSVSVGFGTEDGLYGVHEATFRGSADMMACLNEPSSPWMNIVYELTNNENECEVENGGCEQICLDEFVLYECSCMEGYTLNSDGHSCSDTNECLDSDHHGCDQVCNNTEGSYTCSCREGYALNEDGRTCSVSCGGRLTEASGSFHTPDWPLRYPIEDFRCEWVIDIENATDSVIEISFNKPYGINGHDECPTDYVEVVDGLENSSPSFGRHCFMRRPHPILTTSNTAKVVFQGSSRPRPASRVGASITYKMILKVNECEIDNGGCVYACNDTLFAYSCHCPKGFILADDKHNCSDIDECFTIDNECEHICANTVGSYSCSCREGYALNEDGRTCSVSCGGRLTEASGSFHTPDWPRRYPTEDFRCEWVIDIENATDSVIEISFNKPYGINGRDECPTDYVEVLDGLENSSPSFGRHCFMRRPHPILTTSSTAKVVFQGSSRPRPASRVGVSIEFTVKQKVNECEIDNRCAHTCHDLPLSYSCSCPDGFTLAGDKHNCSDIDECSTNSHGCEQECVNEEGSYSCECRDGYALDDNGNTCSISCGGRLVNSSGSFQTPDWPDRYPQANFVCEWTFNMSGHANSSIQFTVDRPFGINGRPPCENDHLEFFDGLESDSPSLGRFCKLSVPPPITTSTGAARVVFEGRVNPYRPPSRKGIHVLYTFIE